jgi:DNA-binding transcriptional ArsR family regulator
LLAKADTRTDLLSIIQENPGLHFRELQRRSGLANGQLEYHLYQLEKELKVSKRRDGKLLRYFSNMSGNPKERLIVYFLRNRVSREIILDCLAHGGKASTRAFERWKKKSEYIDIINTMKVEDILNHDLEVPSLTDGQLVLSIVKKFRQSFLDTMASAIIDLLGP